MDFGSLKLMAVAVICVGVLSGFGLAADPYEGSPPHEERERRGPSGEDYTFSLVDATQWGSSVVISGRVAGPYCQKLQLQIRAENSYGRTVYATTVVNEVDQGSRLFEVSAGTGVYGDVWMGFPEWEVTGIEARCLDN